MTYLTKFHATDILLYHSVCAHLLHRFSSYNNVTPLIDALLLRGRNINKNANKFTVL